MVLTYSIVCQNYLFFGIIIPRSNSIFCVLIEEGKFWGGIMLKTGKIPRHILKSCVYPYMGKLREEVLIHSSFGEDCSIIDFGDSVAVLSTDPITGADIHSSHLSVYVACNDIAACGQTYWHTVTLLCLWVHEFLKKIMKGY